MKKEILMRADGNSSIGLGHVMRSISLALMLKDNFEITFCCKEPSPSITKTIHENSFQCIAIQDEDDFFRRLRGEEIVVLDGYHFDTAFQKKVKDKGCLLVCIDDLHDKYFFADVVINHAPGVSREKYKTEPYTRFLLGADYALLRPGFLKQAQRERKIVDSGNLLICFGGSDIENLTLLVLQIVLKYPQVKKITVITGSAYSHAEELSEIVKQHAKVFHLHAIQEDQMISCMLEAGLAIVPASGILLEAIACKTPVIAGYYTVNQFDIYQGFLSLNAIYDARKFEAIELENALQKALSNDYEQLIFNQSKCIDGKSRSRFVKFFKQLSYAHTGIG